jgi:hypothetical protein
MHPVVIAASVFALVVGVAPRPANVPFDPPASVAGHLRMDTNAEGLETLIVIEPFGHSAYAEAVATEAFRVQHATPQALKYEGRAVLAYRHGRLIIIAQSHHSWDFVVVNDPNRLTSKSQGVGRFRVPGLSHYWGDTANQVATEMDDLYAGLPCLLSVGCGACEEGGGEACSANCGDGGTCSVSCGGGYTACCSCPGRCRCCRE